MTSATPAPAACGAQLTTIQVDPNTSARLYTMLNSQATPILMWPTKYLHSSVVLCDIDIGLGVSVTPAPAPYGA